MDNERKRLHPLMAGSAVAVIVASGVGVAAVTGLLPGTSAQKAETPPPAMQKAPAQPAAKAPAQPRQQMASAAGASSRCMECATVTGVQTVEVKGEGSGLGAVAGGVAGAVVGNQFGRGDGRTVMTVAGAAGGALAGNELEKHARTHKRYDVALRMEDGSTKTVSYKEMPTWRSGDRVRVVNDQIQPR
jgi:outer membrane lipoprotein SlyB